MNTPRPSRILGLVKLLTVIGLLTMVVTLSLVGWTLARVRNERAQGQEEKLELEQAAQTLHETSALGQQEILNLLTETPGIVTHQSRAAARAQLWHSNYQRILPDLKTQHSLGLVREASAQLRAAVDSLEGRRRLEDAQKFRQWRAASGTNAATLAEAILLEQSQRQSRDTTDFRNQLAECARLVEQLAGEEFFDNLAHLKDNQFKPVFDRMSRAISAATTTETTPDALPATALEQLKANLFGAGYTGDDAHQSIVLGTGGLFPLRRDALQLRRERKHLQQGLAGVARSLETDVNTFTQSIHARTAALTDEMERSLALGWRQLLYSGGGCSVIFLWLAWRISRDIKTQVNALEQARAAAEEGRLTTQKLMQEQQAATAELAAAHQDLQVSEIRFRSLSAAAPIGIFLNDARGAALYFNPYWLNITGLTLEQSLGDGWQRALHPDDAPTVLANRKTANRNGWGFNCEFRFCRPSGEIRWVHARSVAIRSQAGQVTGYVGTTEDITERRKSEELLRLQEAALRSAANVVVITNREGNIVWTNPAFTRITGYTAEEALGKNPRVLKTKTPVSPYPASYYQDLWQTISSGRVWQGEFHNCRKDGSDLIEEATITPVPNDTGELTHFVAVKQDITARKHAEAELAQAQQELLTLSRQAGMAEVATGVLHNVGNVLNSVNVSASCAADRLRKSKLGQLPKVAALLSSHETDLSGFFANDPRARQLPGYLTQLAEHLAGEQTRTLAELAELQKHVDHIKEIVVMQQELRQSLRRRRNRPGHRPARRRAPDERQFADPARHPDSQRVCRRPGHLGG
jgi:PAS domain S-box-containing protein